MLDLHKARSSVQLSVRLNRRLLAVGVIALIFAGVFAYIGSEVMERETRSIDDYVLHGAHALRGLYPWIGPLMRDISGLGSTMMMTLTTIYASCFFWLSGARVKAISLASSIVAASLMVRLFKTAFGRLRPDMEFAEVVQHGLSFPSGHASMSSVVYLTLAALIASTRPSIAEQRYIMGGAMLLVFMIGMSRVALGVHWMTDVIAGWLFGTAWAALSLLGALLVGARYGARVAARRDGAASVRD